MNMNMIMQQAQKMQNDIKKATEEINNTKFVSKKELVEIEMTGDKKATKVKISDSFKIEDKEILEDMILLAINDITSQIDKKMDEKLSKYKGIPKLF